MMHNGPKPKLRMSDWLEILRAPSQWWIMRIVIKKNAFRKKIIVGLRLVRTRPLRDVFSRKPLVLYHIALKLCSYLTEGYGQTLRFSSRDGNRTWFSVLSVKTGSVFFGLNPFAFFELNHGPASFYPLNRLFFPPKDGTVLPVRIFRWEPVRRFRVNRSVIFLLKRVRCFPLIPVWFSFSFLLVKPVPNFLPFKTCTAFSIKTGWVFSVKSLNCNTFVKA